MICRSCQSERMETVIDLGEQYLSDFRHDDLKPKKYPLELMRCLDCSFCQLRQAAPLNEMYTENYGFKSGVNETIRKDLSSIVKQALSYHDGRNLKVLDIGSNDGTLLSNYDEENYRVGVDPIKKLCEEAERNDRASLVINDFYASENVKKQIGKTKFDIITAISMFYDVEDPNKLVADMVSMLADDGVIIIQQNYILATLQNNAYDNICHEHIGYHSLLSMEHIFERNGLETVDVSTSIVNGGVLRTVVQRKGVGFPTTDVQKQRDIESVFGLDTPKPYIAFRHDVREGAKKLTALIDQINDQGKRCYIYGASTRGGTIWQYAGLDVEDLPFAVERNPAKVGSKIASIGVPIISEAQARLDNPEYMLVSIWFFRDEIIKREKEYLAKGGHLIFPLPKLEVI